MDSEITHFPQEEISKRSLTKRIKEQAKVQEINALIQSRKQKSVESKKEMSPQEKSFQIVRTALEKVGMIMEAGREPSELELIAFNTALWRPPKKKPITNLHIIHTSLQEILWIKTPPKAIRTTTPKNTVGKPSLISLKDALRSLEAGYKNNKDGVISKEDRAWYNNILGITTPSDWLTKVEEVRTRLQQMIW
jgi:hypothetical protein